MWTPWFAHFYPGMKPSEMDEISLSLYVSLYDAIKDQLKDG